jgi:hypothetical protein
MKIGRRPSDLLFRPALRMACMGFSASVHQLLSPVACARYLNLVQGSKAGGEESVEDSDTSEARRQYDLL